MASCPRRFMQSYLFPVPWGCGSKSVPTRYNPQSEQQSRLGRFGSAHEGQRGSAILVGEVTESSRSKRGHKSRWYASVARTRTHLASHTGEVAPRGHEASRSRVVSWGQLRNSRAG